MSTMTLRKTLEAGPFPVDIRQPSGFWVMAPNVKVINNVIHDQSVGISAWRDAPDSEYYGNIVYYNGWMGPDRAHGHGVYMQNSEGSKTLLENIVFQQFDLGMQFYSTGNSRVDNFYLEGNVVFQSGYLGQAATRNILLGGGTEAQNPTLIENFTYFPTKIDHGGENNIGYYPFGEGCSNLRMERNTFVSGSIALTLFRCSVANLANNLFYGSQRSFRASDYPNNRYVDDKSRPKGVDIYVRPNRYEEGRANIVVFNWDREDEVAVNLSSAGLREGDLFEIRDVQSYLGCPIATGTYKGETASLSMTSTVVADPIGEINKPPKHTDKEFGVFVVKKIEAQANTAMRVKLEAEDANLESPAATIPDENASNGSAVRFQTPDSGLATFQFKTADSGHYAIWCRVRTPTVEGGEFRVALDGKEDELLRAPSVEDAQQWQWVQLSIGSKTRGRQSPRWVRLKTGEHKLQFRSRDSLMDLDSVLITNNLTFNPASKRTKAITRRTQCGEIKQ
jgi:hypothetical protein